jgi:hypothetical protein
MKKEAINPHNVWKPEDYFNIYHSPELPKTPPEKSGWEQAVRHGDWLFISGQTPTSPDGRLLPRTCMHRCGRLWKTPEISSRPLVELPMTSCPSGITSRLVIWKKAWPLSEISEAITSRALTPRQLASRWCEWRGPTICSKSNQ